MCVVVFFFFKQKTAYEMRISGWSSDVCSSDLAVAGGAVVDAGHLLAELHHGLGSQVLAPLGHPAAVGGGLDAVAPGREVEVHHRALERERPAGLGLDDLALAGPLVLAVAVVAIEDRPHGRPVEALLPFTGVALGRPLAHAGDVGDGGVDGLGRGGDVTGDRSEEHTSELQSLMR